MTTYVIIGLGTAFVFAVLWAALSAKKEQGKAEAIADQSRKEADNVAKAGKIIAENRSDDDTAGRLSDGKF